MKFYHISKKSFVWNENFKNFINKHVSHELEKIEVVGSSKVSLSLLSNKLNFSKNKEKGWFRWKVWVYK